MARIGIFGISSQSGAAYLADIVAEGATTYGYARPSEHGRSVVNAIERQGGIQVDRPENELGELSHFVPLMNSRVGHDLKELAACDLVIFGTHPSITNRRPASWLLTCDGHSAVYQSFSHHLGHWARRISGRYLATVTRSSRSKRVHMPASAFVPARYTSSGASGHGLPVPKAT